MCEYVKRAKKSIDVCIYTLGNKQLVSALMLALDRAVTVRVIIDQTMAVSAKNQLNRLGPKGKISVTNILVLNKIKLFIYFSYGCLTFFYYF